MNIRRSLALVLVIGVILALGGSTGPGQAQGPEPQASIEPQAALGTAFTYQGRLTDNGSPANGDCDFLFELYVAAKGGTPLDSITKPIFNTYRESIAAMT